MAKFYCISPIGKESPDLFQTFIPTFIEQGHEIVTDIDQAEVVMVDYFSGLGNFDEKQIDEVVSRKIKTVIYDEVDYGGMSSEKWFLKKHNTETLSFPEWCMVRIIMSCRVIYFMRKMSKYIEYPSWVYPYEKAIQNDFPITTKEELCSRPYDFCFIGNTSPQRSSAVKGLLDAGLMGIVRWTNESGKIPHDEWFSMHRKAKTFLSADGGGFSDERSYQLITVSAFLRQKNNHLQKYPFSDCINCLEVSEVPTDEEIAGIKAVLSDWDYLYEIYTEGVAYMREYYSEQARANYILETMKKEGII